MRGSDGSPLDDSTAGMARGGRAGAQSNPSSPSLPSLCALCCGDTALPGDAEGCSTAQQPKESPVELGELCEPESKGTKINSISSNTKYTELEMACFSFFLLTENKQGELE